MWDKILALFGKKQVQDDKRIQDNEDYVIDYEDDKDINFTAIFSNKIANYVMNDSNVDIEGDDKRALLIQDVVRRLKKKLKKLVSRELGTGGVLAVPYVANNKLYFNIIAQNRFIINKKIGEDIIDCTMLSEHIVREQKNYYRWTDYTLKDGNLYISHRATVESSPISLETIAEWATIQDMAITNVNKMPFMYVKSPVDNRKENDDYGVPITYGCKKQISKIMHTLRQIEREFDLKEVFVGADSTMFKGEGALSDNGLYKKINSGDDGFWEVFDPAFRDSPLFNKLMQECALLEKQIGTSRGILTDPLSTYQNSDEARRATQDTFSIVDDVRDGLEDGLEDFIYACDVLANYYNLTPQGKFDLNTDWSYSMIESTTEEFNQLASGVNHGVIKKSELRQYLKPNETLEEAEKAIQEIREQNPTIKDLLGE